MKEQGTQIDIALMRQRHLARMLVSSHASEVTAWLSANQLTIDDVQWLNKQGLAPYVYFRLRAHNLLGYLPQEARLALQTYYRYGALLEAVQHEEATTRVLAVLREVGVEMVILKGMALAHTVYPTPRYRLKGDLDIWIKPEQCPTAIAALQKFGYHPRPTETRPPAFIRLYGGEKQLVSDMPGSGLVELQWPPIRGEWARLTTAIDHESIWARRVEFVLEGQQTHIMSGEDMLLHLCFHQGISHQFGMPWLRGLLDVHLLIQAYEIDWKAIQSRSRAWRISIVVWAVLGLSQRLLGTPIPASVLTTLSPSPLRRRLIELLHLEQVLLEMWDVHYQHSRFPIQLLLTDRPSDALKLLWRSLFPEAEWLQARYATDSRSTLWRARLLHSWSLLSSAKV